MPRLTRLAAVAFVAVALCAPTRGQIAADPAASPDIRQFDLAAAGRDFLKEHVSQVSFLLVGGLHGDTGRIGAMLWKVGIRLIRVVGK
jgi:hypothetical protein